MDKWIWNTTVKGYSRCLQSGSQFMFDFLDKTQLREDHSVEHSTTLMSHIGSQVIDISFLMELKFSTRWRKLNFYWHFKILETFLTVWDPKSAMFLHLAEITKNQFWTNVMADCSVCHEVPEELDLVTGLGFGDWDSSWDFLVSGLVPGWPFSASLVPGPCFEKILNFM